MGDKVLPFAGYWLLNGVTLFIFSLIWPASVVFGNANFAPIVAVIWTAFILTVVVSAVQPVLENLKIKLPKDYYKGLVYLLVNAAALWILARWLQAVSGFGIGAFYVAIVAGIAVTLCQWELWEILKKFSPSKKRV